MLSINSLFVFGLLVTWATPVWVMSVGVALGVALLAIAWGLLYVVSRPAAAWAVAAVREGILLPIGYLALGLTAFALLAPLLVPGLPYRPLINSVSRLSAVGDRNFEIVIPASKADFPLDELRLRLIELGSFSAESDETVAVKTNVQTNFGQFIGFRLTPGNTYQWFKPVSLEGQPPPKDDITDWSATNVGDKPATLIIHTVTNVEFPEVKTVPLTSLALVGLFAVYFLLRALSPKVAAIATTTAKEAMSQPLFYVVLALGSFSILAFVFVPYNTFGEDVKMLKDSGLTLIMVLAMIVAVWAASVSVSEEVEGRTALTVLCKPVKRRQFVLGKFLGVLGPVVVLFIVLGFLFLITISYKVVYDSREVARSEPPWQLCYMEMMRTVPGLVLAFMETVVLASISVAISTRLPMIANLIVCASIYVLGHLVPMLVNSSVGKFEIVRFVGQFIATVLPVLDHFNIQAAVAAGAAVPLSYLGWALAYCVLYSTIAMLLGLAMFEDRDLA